MAAKHDGKRARANHWVMQQNLAKQKGGRPLYGSKPKTPRVASAAPAASAPAAPEGSDAATAVSSSDE